MIKIYTDHNVAYLLTKAFDESKFHYLIASIGMLNLLAYTDSDYAGASLDMKSTTGGFQFLGSGLISWKCKKQTVVANSTVEA
nr:putative ribonuclease H-like domain-containing protein [Tanacetum cinerariifolium]